MTGSPPTPFFLAPISSERFFADYWERATLPIHRDAPGYFADVLAFDELDRLVTSDRIPASNFNLARGDTPLPPSAYTVDGAFVDKPRVLALHRDGATIIMRSVEQWSTPLNRVRIAAEEFFEFESQINVYLTPASERSTPPHWDTHDLLILQIAGSKRWRLFRGRRTLPLAEERFRIREDYVSSDVVEVVLHPGDTLYLPRGVIHEPVAETYSAHVSIGVHTRRYHDLVEVALRLAAQREGSPLRRSLPRGCRLDDGAAAAEMVNQLLDPAVLGEAAEVLRREHTSGLAVDLRGRLGEIAADTPVVPSARYHRRGGVSIEAHQTATGLRLVACGQNVDLPLEFRDAVDYVAVHDSFTADDLPGPNDNQQRLALCVALSQIGAVRTDPVTPAP